MPEQFFQHPYQMPKGQYLTAAEVHAEKGRKSAEKKQNRRARIVPIVGTIALFSSLSSNAYWNDVLANEIASKQATVSVAEVHPKDDSWHDTGPQPDDIASVYSDGFGTYNGNYLARSLNTAIREIIPNGPVFSTSYNNALLERSEIVQETYESLINTGRTKVSFVGYSQGGIVALESAADIMQYEPITVDTVILGSTPFGINGIRTDQRDTISAAETALSAIPGSQYSTYVDYISNLVGNSERYTSPGNGVDVYALSETISWINERTFEEQTMPNNNLRMQQIYKITHADFEKEFEAIASQRYNKPLPLIIYFKTAINGDKPTSIDTQVNDDYSSEKIREAAERAGVRCVVIEVPGITHGGYGNEAELYKQALADNRVLIDSLRTLNKEEFESYQRSLEDLRGQGPR